IFLQKGVASRPPKPVGVVSDKPRYSSPKCRAVKALDFKPLIEEKRKAPVVPVGKGKALLLEDVPSTRKKVV
ncbi:hypothetical protein A2U01_0110170, partial [Trifolium medium]|nr:hypothetical protein [Trifolium medium]